MILATLPLAVASQRITTVVIFPNGDKSLTATLRCAASLTVHLSPLAGRVDLSDKAEVVMWESIKDFGYGVICFLVILAIPFSLGLGLLLAVGAAWWIAVPIALVSVPFVRSLLFGPPCGSGHRHRRSILDHVLTALVVGLGSFGLWRVVTSM